MINPLDPTLTERFLSWSPEEETALTEPRLCHCGMAGCESGGRKLKPHTPRFIYQLAQSPAPGKLSDNSECHDVSMGHMVVMHAMA